MMTRPIAIVLAASLACGALPAGAQEDPPEAEPERHFQADRRVVLESGTGYAFEAWGDEEGRLQGFTIGCTPADKAAIPRTAILIVRPSDEGLPMALAVGLAPSPEPGKDAAWDVMDQIREAVKDQKFPLHPLLDYPITVQFLDRKSESLGAPLAGKWVSLRDEPDR